MGKTKTEFHWRIKCVQQLHTERETKKSIRQTDIAIDEEKKKKNKRMSESSNCHWLPFSIYA